MTENQYTYCKIINHLHGIQSKVMGLEGAATLERRFERLQKCFEELDLYVHNPIHEEYNETRIDCEATISGDSLKNLRIVEVIKPIIYNRVEGENHILQRAVIIAEGE